jgi:predicted DNA-binding protein (MmcQ/YjbR family)
VKPGYHMNKVHWNTVTPVPDSDVDAKLFWELLIHSYELVRTSLTKKILAGLPEYSK